MTPKQVLAAKTAKTAARRFHEWLRKNGGESAVLWTPERTRELGWGDGWSVCWEGGPYDWVMVTAGCQLHCGNVGWGDYSTPGPFPGGLQARGWLAEPYNGFILNFYPDR